MDEFSIDDLCSTNRSRNLVLARQIAMYLGKKYLRMSFVRLGETFSHRDHTTVSQARYVVAVQAGRGVGADRVDLEMAQAGGRQHVAEGPLVAARGRQSSFRCGGQLTWQT